MSKYVSFSLWGDNPIYNIGAIKNSILMPTIYPDWKMVVFHDDTVPTQTLENLTQNNVILKNVTSLNLYGMFWRFLIADFEDCEYAVFRDCDSRISEREKMAVDEWIEKDATIHVMRDHPYHMIPCGATNLSILGGMWGIKGKKIKMQEMIETFSSSYQPIYGLDQKFLTIIYSMFNNDRVTHDEFFEKKPFPSIRKNGRFIGERIDVNDNPLTTDHFMIQ